MKYKITIEPTDMTDAPEEVNSLPEQIDCDGFFCVTKNGNEMCLVMMNMTLGNLAEAMLSHETTRQIDKAMKYCEMKRKMHRDLAEMFKND